MSYKYLMDLIYQSLSNSSHRMIPSEKIDQKCRNTHVIISWSYSESKESSFECTITFHQLRQMTRHHFIYLSQLFLHKSLDPS